MFILLWKAFVANPAYGDEEIVRDINDINVKILQLEDNELKKPWYMTGLNL